MSRNLRYRPGHEGYAFFTAAFPNGSAANSTQWIGIFNTIDGMAVGFNGTTFSILYRSNSVNTIISQSSFNMDTLNGSGPSGFTINTKNLNVFRLSYGWLGAAPLKFQILGTTGTWITFHVIQLPNTITTPSFTNPMLPVQMAVTNTGNTSDLRIASGSWDAGAISNIRSRAGFRTFALESVFASTDVGTTEKSLLVIQNKPTFDGKTNTVELRVTGFGGGPLITASTTMSMRLRLNATVTGTSFTDVNTSASVVSYSTVGTYTAGTGTILYVNTSDTQGNGSMMQLFSQKDAEIILLPGQTLTLTAQTLGGGVMGVETSLLWEERF